MPYKYFSQSALFVFMCASAICVQAEIYKCREGTNTIFSDKPCGAQVEVIAPVQSGNTIQGLEQKRLDEINLKTRRTVLEGRIRRAERALAQYKRRSRNEVSVLQGQLNALEKEQRKSGQGKALKRKMAEVKARYRNLIDDQSGELKQLRKELSGLK